MRFRTEIEITKANLELNHTMSGLAIGSCFAENISNALAHSKFNITSNPFGVVYNPASVAEVIARLNSQTKFDRHDLDNDKDLWFSFAHHGSFSSIDPDQALAKMNAALDQGGKAINRANYIIITLGTAWVYELKRSGKVVANCHKVAAAEFTRRKLSVDQVIECFTPLIEGSLIDKQVIFTVSPMRHIKDGLEQNALSKATLNVAVHELANKFTNVHYFPSYEIMTDDLRDYRFYAQDMLHPSAAAISYIWELFCNWSMSDTTQDLIKKIERITDAASHRPFNPQSDEHRKFVKSMSEYTQALAKRYPYIDFIAELNCFGA